MADLADINVSIEVDDTSVLKGIDRVARLEKGYGKLDKAFNKGKITAQQYSKGIQQVDSAIKRATTSTRAYADAQMAATKASNRMGVVTQQAGYQVSDFIVQVQSGTNAFVAFGQQASQLVGVLPLIASPLGLTAGAAVGLSAALGIAIPLVTAIGAAITRSGKDAEDAAEGFKTFEDALESITKKADKLQEKRLSLTTQFDPEIYEARVQMMPIVDNINRLVLEQVNLSGKALELNQNLVKSEEEKLRVQTLQVQAAMERIREDEEFFENQERLKKVEEDRAKAEEAFRERARKALNEEFEATLAARKAIAKARKQADEKRAKREKKAHEVRMGYIALEARSQMLLGTAPMFMNTGSLERAAQIYKDRKAAEEAAAKGGPKAPRDALVSLTKNLELERELLGVEQDRASVLQALGESRNKYTEEQIQQAVNVTREIRVQTEALEKQKQVGDMVGQSFETAFMSIVDGTKSVQDAFRIMAADIIKELYRIFVVKQITGMISGAVQGYMAGPVPSLDGGGYTGSGPRSGGLDGKGGFMAMLHPRETVIDHTKGQSVGGGDTVTVNQTINVSTGVQQTVRTEIKQLMPQIAENAKAAVVDAKRRGGSYGRSFA
jgi:hypothetical protein